MQSSLKMLAGLSSCGVGQVPKETERCGLPCKKIRYVGGRSLFRYNSARPFGRHGLLFWGGIVGHGLFFIYAFSRLSCRGLLPSNWRIWRRTVCKNPVFWATQISPKCAKMRICMRYIGHRKNIHILFIIKQVYMLYIRICIYYSIFLLFSILSWIAVEHSSLQVWHLKSSDRKW